MALHFIFVIRLIFKYGSLPLREGREPKSWRWRKGWALTFIIPDFSKTNVHSTLQGRGGMMLAPRLWVLAFPRQQRLTFSLCQIRIPERQNKTYGQLPDAKLDTSRVSVLITKFWCSFHPAPRALWSSLQDGRAPWTGNAESGLCSSPPGTTSVSQQPGASLRAIPTPNNSALTYHRSSGLHTWGAHALCNHKITRDHTGTVSKVYSLECVPTDFIWPTLIQRTPLYLSPTIIHARPSCLNDKDQSATATSMEPGGGKVSMGLHATWIQLIFSPY